MSDDTTAKPAVAQPAEAASGAATNGSAAESAAESAATVAETKAPESEKSGAAAADATATEKVKSDDKASKEDTSATAVEPTAPTDEDANDDAEMVEHKSAMENPEFTAGAEKTADAADDNANDTAPATSKSQPRRKSTGVADKGKKLNRKASKVKILHLDAKPGEHYFAKLKGFPPWPVVICEEDMLPHNMLNSRPVTAARPDGTYRDDFADGGRRAGDRTFPVMYLHTNEFSWTPNTDLSELDPATVGDMVTTKMRKDLQAAHALAAEGHDLDYYKNVLREFEEQRLAKAEAKKSKAKTPKKSSKATDEDDDVEMEDAEDEAVAPAEKKSKSKKRKAEDENSTPQRSDSVKKPKIKLTNVTTPKNANGVQTPTKDSAKPNKAKAKSKGGKEADGKKEKEAAAPKEPELTPEERRARREKEILFLRHRLQRGLLPREGSPVPDEMKQVSDFLAKLETFPDLDVSIIRVTKINKVLKAILKLDTIPKEEEFKFKPRSQTLLDKWNILLTSDGAPAPTSGAAANANGVNGNASATAKNIKETANGVKEGTADSKTESEKNAPKAKDLAEDEEEVDKAEEAAKTASATTETES
jgi:hypothetical protein